QQRNGSACRPEQTGHQVHQSRLPCPIRSNQTRNARRDLQVYSIDSKYLSVELGDIIEDDELISSVRHTTLDFGLRNCEIRIEPNKFRNLAIPPFTSPLRNP